MPATEQLNIRVTPTVKEKFRERALREGMSQAQLLEALLKQRGRLPVPDPSPAPQGDRDGHAEVATGPAPTPPRPDNDVTDFAVWLAGRTGVPRALTARAIAAGRVTVQGVPWTSGYIPKVQLSAGGVVYDGQEL